MTTTVTVILITPLGAVSQPAVLFRMAKPIPESRSSTQEGICSRCDAGCIRLADSKYT